MINVKPEMIAALRGNSDLIALLGLDQDNNPKIYFQIATYEEDYPHITYFELDNTRFMSADDEELVTEIAIQLDIWTRPPTSPTAITDLVEKTLGGLYQGTVNISGTSVSWVSGDHFNTSWPAGKIITINGLINYLAATPTATAMPLQNSAGILSGVSYSADALGYGRISCHDLYDFETKCYHRALRMMTRRQK